MLKKVHDKQNEKVRELDSDGDEIKSQISSFDCEDNEADFFVMDGEEKKRHMVDLWRRAFINSRAGGRVIRIF